MPFDRLRNGLASAIVVVLAVAVSGYAPQTSGRWYDAYSEGLKAIQRGDWVTAEQRLLDARSSGPKPSRKAFVYGDSYIPFLPDYYLAVVYLNTGRPREAEKEFEVVRSQKLIGPKDPEYAEFQKQSQQATADRIAFDTKQTTPIATAKPVPAPPTPAPATPDSTTASNPNALNPPAGPSQMGPGSNEYNPTNVPLGGGTTKPDTTVASKSPDARTVVIPPRPVLPPPPVPAPSVAMEEGLVAFFSGDYRNAVDLLAVAAQQPGASPRARLFLACAEAGLVLTGGGDADLLRTARADYRNADPQRTLTNAQRQFISPRVLDQLERP